MDSPQNIYDVTPIGNIPMCNKVGRLCTLPQYVMPTEPMALANYPKITINCETYNTATTAGDRWSDSFRNVMVPVNECVPKSIMRTYFESGFLEALNEARRSTTSTSYPYICAVAEFIYRVLNTVENLKLKLFPYKREQGVTSVIKYSETRDWLNSMVRCIVWHPNCFKIAVASCDDVVRVYTYEPEVVATLKNSNQKWITCMAWRPLCPGELAVGCQKGVCLWTLDNNTPITRTSSQAAFLKHTNHGPITSLQWHPDGILLATSSISDTNILIWNVDRMQSTMLRRVGPPCSLLKWSPDGAYLFSATVGNVFRVWSTTKVWSPERWVTAGGTIQSACWSPCGTFLLFVTTTEQILYRLQLFGELLLTDADLPNRALPIADLSKFIVGGREVGGQPQSLVWAPNGLFLAIMFKDSPCVALFSTCILKLSLTISPLCSITGIDGAEYPTSMCFQGKYENGDNVLTIGWSSGRIQYLPLTTM